MLLESSRLFLLHVQKIDDNFLVFCSVQVHFCSIFFTRWNAIGWFSIGLMPGLLIGIRKSRAPVSNVAFFAFKEFWVSPSFRNNVPRGLLLYSKVFSKCSLKLSCQLFFILLTRNCFVTMGNSYKHFHHFTTIALFLFFCGAFQCQTLWFFTHCCCSSSCSLVTSW